MNTTRSIAMRWQQRPERRISRRRAGSDGLVGPIVRPVWPAWADDGPSVRPRREPQRVDPLRRPRAQGCG